MAKFRLTLRERTGVDRPRLFGKFRRGVTLAAGVRASVLAARMSSRRGRMPLAAWVVSNG